MIIISISTTIIDQSTRLFCVSASQTVINQFMPRHHEPTWPSTIFFHVGYRFHGHFSNIK